MSGCCVDKACTPETCMTLAEGETCGSCVHLNRCAAIFGCKPTGKTCDWFPRRYHRALQAAAKDEVADAR